MRSSGGLLVGAPARSGELWQDACSCISTISDCKPKGIRFLSGNILDGVERVWDGVVYVSPTEDSKKSDSLRPTEELIPTGSQKVPATQTGYA